MSQHCELRVMNLGELKAQWLEPTKQGYRNVMRVVRIGEALDRARAIYFVCPRCTDKKHGLTFIFDFPDTPPKLMPLARFKVRKFPCQMNELTLLQEIHSTCGVSGRLINGELSFRCRG